MDAVTPAPPAEVPSAAPEVEEKEDRWGAAEEAFEAVVPDEKKEEVKEVKAPDSQIEVEVPNYLKLDDLHVPGKYKEVVKERLQKVVSEIEAKQKEAVEKSTQELGQHQDAVRALVGIFQDIARTPKEELPTKLAGYIEQYGNHIGVDPSTAQGLRQQQIQRQEQQAAVTIETINKQFLDRMVKTEDPNEFRALWEQSDLLKSQVMEQQTLNKVGMLLKAYHDQYIAPDKQTLLEYRTRAEHEQEVQGYNTRKSAWNSAQDTLKSKYPDFEKYTPKMSQLIKSQKAFGAARDALNADAEDLEGRTAFLEQMYLAVSRSDALESVKRPTQGGLPPTKHVATKKQGGGNWDSAYENTKELWD